MRWLPLRVLLVGLLTACAGSPQQPRYFLLRSPAAEGSGAMSVSQAYAMGRFEVAPYLEQTGIVLATGEGEIRPANLNRWAEPPRQALERFVGEEVSRTMGEDVTRAVPRDGMRVVDVRIDQLHGTADGRARLVAAWSVRDAAHPPQYYRFSRSADLASSGYAALVDSMKALLSELSRDIAESLAVPNASG